jgi:hypothetical protein
VILAVLAVACSDDDPSTTTTGGGGQPGVGGGTAGSGAGAAGGGGSSGNDWSCIGQLEAKTFEAGDAVGNLTVVELQDDSPLVDITVNVCSVDDTDCATPLDSGVTDADGRVTLDVTKAEQRYLELTGPGILDAISFNNGPPRSDPFDELVRVISPESFAVVENLIGVTADPTRGHAGIQANDCQGAIGVGVTFEISTADADTVIGYFSPVGAPNPALTETGVDGRAAVANIPAGPATITATVAATGQVIGTRTFFVRPEAIAYPACVEADPEAM